MQKQKIYITPENKKVVATFYKENVFWYFEEKPESKGVDNMETFFKKIAWRGWKEL